MTKYASALLLAMASLQVSAGQFVGRTAQVQEVVPGPGLPSLKSIGVTSADLYAIGAPKNTLAPDSAQFNMRCGPTNSAYGPVQDIIACYHYLNALGTTKCGVNGNYAVVEFCHAGQGHVTGQGLLGNSESSYCRDVAAGLLYVINGCTRPQQDCAGFNAAAGNGNLIVGGTNIHY